MTSYLKMPEKEGRAVVLFVLFCILFLHCEALLNIVLFD